MESVSRGTLWTGRIFSLLAALPFLMSSAMKFVGSPQVIDGMGHYGWPPSMIFTLAVLELGSVLVYLLPPVSILGAILLTGFLGGAIATHLRIGEPVYIHIVIGILIWLGVFLREPRLRVLIPVRGRDFIVDREINVNQSPEIVFAYLRRLKNFQNWNPFLKKDPNAKMDFSGIDGQPGAILKWNGNKELGSGEQELIRIIEGKRIEFELRFKTPFAATNSGSFAIEGQGSSVSRVRWQMSGKMVFPMTVIGLFVNLENLIGKEFDGGLVDLKRLLEK